LGYKDVCLENTCHWISAFQTWLESDEGKDEMVVTKLNKTVFSCNQDREKNRPTFMWMDGVELYLRNVYINTENRSFGRNKMGICHKGNQGQS